MLHEDEEPYMADEEPPHSSATIFPPKFHVMGSSPIKTQTALDPESPLIEPSPDQMLHVGVNGRCNKVADTCYTFWVGGSLGVGLYSIHDSLFNNLLNVDGLDSQ